MVVAQAIIRHLKEQGTKVDKEKIVEIIGHFVEGEESQYSLSNILKYARWKFNLNPGQWFNIGQISEVLRKIQDEAPLKGTENLKIAFFSQSVIFKSKIIEKAGYCYCNCGAQNPFFCDLCHYQDDFTQPPMVQPKLQQSQFLSQIVRNQKPLRTMSSSSDYGENLKPIYSEEIDVSQPEKTHKLKTQIMLIVSVRVGEKRVEEIESKIIKELLSISTSLGAMGGVPSKALYLVGLENDKFVYLDPHLVQEFVGREETEENFSTFFCQDYRTISGRSLDPSMAFCYYLKTIEDAQELVDKVEDISKKYKDRAFISIMDDDNFSEQIKAFKQTTSEISSDQKASMQYNSLEFRDIEESY